MKDKKEKLESLLIALDNLRETMTRTIGELSSRVEDALKETDNQPKEYELIPFDIEKAKQGAKVMTRDGHDVRILCFDRNSHDYPIVALIQQTKDDEGDAVETYQKNGTYFNGNDESDNDLFILED